MTLVLFCLAFASAPARPESLCSLLRARTHFTARLDKPSAKLPRGCDVIQRRLHDDPRLLASDRWSSMLIQSDNDLSPVGYRRCNTRWLCFQGDTQNRLCCRVPSNDFVCVFANVLLGCGVSTIYLLLSLERCDILMRGCVVAVSSLNQPWAAWVCTSPQT